ncbi:9130_t:CDS:2, partial [Acaulospora colombiana]
VFVSPRQRAQTTFHKLFEGQELPPHDTTESVREWDYGDYEGLTISQIKVKNPNWVIWRDGCPGGESPEDITKRIDDTIAKRKELAKEIVSMKYLIVYKRYSYLLVMIVAHGHFLRAFISRWVEFHVCLGTHFNVEPASVALLTYQHNNCALYSILVKISPLTVPSRVVAEPSLTGLNLYAFGD